MQQNTVEGIFERVTQNTVMCQCPICGHTKESTCEYLTEKSKVNKALKPCFCCVDKRTGKAVGSKYLSLVK